MNRELAKGKSAGRDVELPISSLTTGWWAVTGYVLCPNSRGGAGIVAFW